MRHTARRMSLLILERASGRVTSVPAADGLILNLVADSPAAPLPVPSPRGRAFPLELRAWPGQRCPPQQARSEDAQERKERPAQARPSSESEASCSWRGPAWAARGADGVLLGAVGTWNATASLPPQPEVSSLPKSVVLMVQCWLYSL